jgi:hypothetical protein
LGIGGWGLGVGDWGLGLEVSDSIRCVLFETPKPNPRQIYLDHYVCRNHAVGDAANQGDAQGSEAMVLIIFIAVLAVIGAVFFIYVVQSRPTQREIEPIPPSRHFDGLFESNRTVAPQDVQQIEARRNNFFARARCGDFKALVDARDTRDEALYCEVLNAIVDWAAESQEKLETLVSHVKNNELRGNKRLAQRVIENWKAAPGRRSTIEMIHIAALSDDAETYAQAVDAAMDLWRRGYLAKLSTDELVELFVSQFWVIAPESRRGGGGYALKRRLLGLRRELASATPAR